MTFKQKKTIPETLLMILLLLGLSILSSYGQEPTAEPAEPPQIFYPDASSVPVKNTSEKALAIAQPSTSYIVSQVAVFLLLLGVGVWMFLFYFKRGNLNLKVQGSNNRLVVSETKTLGNKQYLVVVEFGEQKMLLGVGPGMINHLCYLQNPFESNAVFQDGDAPVESIQTVTSPQAKSPNTRLDERA